MDETACPGGRPRVVIFRSALLPVSETFVREQAEALQRFEPIYAGLKQVRSGLPLSRRSILLTLPGSRWSALQILFYELIGRSPFFESQIEESRPSLLHAHFAIDGALVLPLVKRLNLPLIVSLHGYDVTCSDESLRKKPSGVLYLLRRRELWERAHSFLCVSEFIRDKALEAGFPAEKLRVHYTGVNCAYFSRSDGARDGGVLFAGRLVEKKGCSYLLDAMAEVNRRIPGTVVTVIGDGPLRTNLEAQAKQLGISARFLGALPVSEVRAWMSRACVFCVPSVRADNGDSEGFGMVFAEAQAMGTPVVSFHHGGIPEAVDDGRTGILVPERDKHALAEAITRLLSDIDLWESFSVRGPERIREEYSLLRQTRLLEDIYEVTSKSSKSTST